MDYPIENHTLTAWDPSDLPDQSGRTLVVTGATAGIGYFAAEQLAAAGAHVVLAGRSPERLEIAATAIREQVPAASLGTAVVDLSSLASVRDAGAELAALDRLDGLLLNGGSMAMRARDRTVDGLPLLAGTHVVANAALVAHTLPALLRTGARHDVRTRVVHTSSGFVDRLRRPVVDALPTSRSGVVAYTRAKAVTEVFAFELDRRLRSAGAPTETLVSRPGVGVDARTPHRPGIRDASVPARPNPYTPWAQGKDAAAWSAVRALTDPGARGGELYAPANGRRGLPVRVQPGTLTASPAPQDVASVWRRLEELVGVDLPVASGTPAPDHGARAAVRQGRPA